MNDYKTIAEKMTGVSWDNIPEGARDHLHMTDLLCRNADGGLISRQVIGMILAPYLKPLYSPYIALTVNMDGDKQ